MTTDKPADVRRVIGDPGQPIYDRSDLVHPPTVVGEAVGVRAFSKRSPYCSNVIVREPVVRSSSARRLKRILAAFVPHGMPAVRRLAGDPQTTGDLGLGNACSEQLPREASPPCSLPFRRSGRRSEGRAIIAVHGRTISDLIASPLRRFERLITHCRFMLGRATWLWTNCHNCADHTGAARRSCVVVILRL